MNRDLEAALREARAGVASVAGRWPHLQVLLTRIDAALSAASGETRHLEPNEQRVMHNALRKSATIVHKASSGEANKPIIYERDGVFDDYQGPDNPASGEASGGACFQSDNPEACLLHPACGCAASRPAPSEAPNVEREQLVEKSAKALFDRFAPDHMFYTTDDPNFTRWRDYASIVLDKAEESFLAERRQLRFRIAALEKERDSARAEGIAAERERILQEIADKSPAIAATIRKAKP